MHKFSLPMLILALFIIAVSFAACDGAKNTNGDAAGSTTDTTSTAQTAATTAAPTLNTTTETPTVTTQAPVATTTTAPATTTTTAPVTTTTPQKVVLDAEMDALYTEQNFHYPTTPLYIYSSKPENRNTDSNGNALSCRSSGVLDFCFDGDYLWYYCTIYDTTMFGPDPEYVLTDHNPWQTDSIEVWYSFDGKRLLHVDVDAWGLRLFTDDNSTSVNFDEVVYRVKNDRDAGVWYAEIGIPAKDETGKALTSGDTVYIALQINDLMTDFEVDNSRTDNLAFNGGHKINNFKKVVLP